MPVVELASASLQDNEYTEFSDQLAASDIGAGGSSSDFSSTKGRMGIGGDYLSKPQNQARHPPKSTKSGNASVVQSAFTNFTESLSHSSEEFQDGIQKTFSSLVNSFSRDGGVSSSDSGYKDSAGSSEWTGSDESSKSSKAGLSWSEFVLPEGIRSRVSSLTSRSSSSQTDTTNSSLSSRSALSPTMNSGKVAIMVNSSGLVLRESSEESSSSPDTNSEASWRETASRDVSLLDTIGESSGEEDADEQDGSSSSGSESGSEVDDEGQDVGQDDGDNDILYDYDDDSTEFNSDVGLEDLGAVMLQIGSCHFEPESASQSFDDDYSYTSDMFPSVVSNYMNSKHGDNNSAGMADLQSEAARNAIFQRRLQQQHRRGGGPAGQAKTNQQQNGITGFFNKAFSCGAQI